MATSELEYILDGSMGKYLISIGVPKNKKLWSAVALIEPEYHNMVIEAHKAYLNCGCNVITTNNYAVTPGYLRYENLQHKINELTKLSLKLAETARTQFMNELKNKNIENINKNIKIAGCLPPLIESYRPDLRLSNNESIKYYMDIIQALNGCDIYLGETMGCIDEAISVLTAINAINGDNMDKKETWISFSLDDDGNLRSGETMNDALLAISKWIKCCNIKVLSFNCCSVEAVNNFFKDKQFNSESLDVMKKNNIILGIYPNQFETPNLKDWTLKDGAAFSSRNFTAKLFYDQYVSKWLLQHGKVNRIGMIGGCCGFVPDHIMYITKQLHCNSQVIIPSVTSQILSKAKLVSKL